MLFPVFSSSLVVLAVTIQRQGMVTLLQYCTPYETKDVFTVCCSFTIITFYSIITRTITITDTRSASCVCVCGGFVRLCVWVCVCVLSCVFGVSVFSAQSLSSQRRSWEESIAWGWCWGLVSLRPVLNPLQLPGQRSPWSHWRALSSSGRCPDWGEEAASLTPPAPCHRARPGPGRGRTGAPVHQGDPRICRVGSSSSCGGVRAARSGWRSGSESAGCQPETRSQRRWRWCCAGGWNPPRSRLLQSGVAGRPTRSKGGGGARGRCGPACQRCGTSSAASNMDSDFPGSLSSYCNPHYRHCCCPPPRCHHCSPTPPG